MTTTSCDISASRVQVDEALIALHTIFVNACPLLESCSKENWGSPQMPCFLLFGTCLTSIVKGNTLFIALVVSGSKENLGRPEMPDLILFGTLFNLYG